MFDDISTEDLQAELDRRQKVKQELLKPKQPPLPDIEPLQRTCQDYIDAIVKDGMASYVYAGLEYYIFECAMETIFGEDVCQFINSKQ